MKPLLYLEDDEALAYITSRTLEREGFTVSCVHDIESAKAVIALHDFRYALLDLKIGFESSLPLVKDLADKGVNIVVLSGYGSIPAAVQAVRDGAINFLSKPSSTAEIVYALEDLSTELVKEQEPELPSLKNQEWQTIQKALFENDGNISATARQLNMHRRTLQRKLQKRQLN